MRRGGNKMIKKFKTILLFLIMSLMSIMCFSEEDIYKNKIDNRYNLLIEYNDVKLVPANRYEPIKILDKNDNIVFTFNNFNKRNGNIAKTDKCVIIFDDMCIIYFYGISFEDVRDCYWYSYGASILQKYLCKKVIVEIRK